jgi:hypothetical protein
MVRRLLGALLPLPVEELELILGHHHLKALGDVSLDKAMGMTHWALYQV